MLQLMLEAKDSTLSERTHASLDELQSAYLDAICRLRLMESDRTCWTNPEKRAQVLAARIAYQDAKLAYMCSCADHS